ncbi:hypothetical protein PC114_g447 [Phytophthora cactorum]|nr:hypothetical protein PC114_g447 [Phytophthora cactorum]KAG2983710.1 hypothetical protein PC120_g24385 [Phytophthora cactorum]KAG4064841.1 hypothetical protein PC123_g401 [Phytophthora cactorum]
MNLLYAEHRELYKRKYGSGTQEEAVVGVSEQAEQSLAESILNKEADALVAKWVDLRVEWVEVAKKQYVTKEERVVAVATSTASC